MNLLERTAPWLPDLRRSSGVTLRGDLQAGITVAIFAIPQTMAYAILAGVSPAYGLYAAMVMSIVAALWGSSAFVNTGPTNSAALLTAAALLPYAQREDTLAVLLAFTLLVGLIRFGLGVIRAGKLIDYVPESAFLGFTIGAGSLIALGQLHHLFNVPRPDATWFPQRFIDTVKLLPDANPLALGIGLGTAAIMFTCSRFARKFPVALLAIVAASVAAALAGDSVRLVRDLAPVPSGLPGFSLPAFDPRLYRDLFPAALAVAVIGLIEAVSIGQFLALKHRTRLDYDQEFMGQGLSHIVGAFFQGIPGSGSFSRSLLMEQAGARTRFGNVFFGIAMGITVLTCPALLNRIPITALAGLLLYIGVKLVDLPRVRRVWATSRADGGVLLLTFLVTVFVRIELGIFAGIIAAAFLVLRRTRNLHVMEIVPQPGDCFCDQEMPPPQDDAPCDVVTLTLGGDLNYTVAGAFRKTLEDIIAYRKPRFIIVRMRRAYSMDSSLWSVFFDVAEVYHADGGKLYLCGIRPDFDAIIDQARMRDVIPDAHIFHQQEEIYRAFRACLGAVKAQLGDTPTLTPEWAAYFGKQTSREPDAS